MRGVVKQLERKVGRSGPQPLAHLSDDEVPEALCFSQSFNERCAEVDDDVDGWDGTDSGRS